VNQPKQTDLFQDVKYEPLDKSKTQRCSTCKKYKPFNMFAFREPTVAKSLRSECRKCKNISDRLVAQLKLENPKPVDKNYKCPCCGIKEKKLKSYGRWSDRSVWVLDHNHLTNTFRAWICNGCNIGLGRFNDDIKKLNNAIKYLKNYDK
jgi:hypothetical protein